MKLEDIRAMQPGDTLTENYVMVHRKIDNTGTGKPVFRISAHRLVPLLTGNMGAYGAEGAFRQVQYYLNAGKPDAVKVTR
ncbi:MAG TPA: hypothetical protein VMQ17_23905 [Candidatus Sulfotelmatobacter sp.]|nr:hypothetical protein [Candidatus Sulfotelmatobacter sp.]